MQPISSHEPLGLGVIPALMKALGPIGSLIVELNDVDFAAGAGVINDETGTNAATRVIWTKSGHRITIWYSPDGGWGASKSKEIDPAKPTT